MKIAIVDDNRAEQIRLHEFICLWAQKTDSAVETEFFDNGDSFARTITAKSFDLVFMDILMQGTNGIMMARRLRETDLSTLLVFITSSPEFMAQAFPCHAFDYVTKPYTERRIAEVLDEACRALGKRAEVIQIGAEKFLLSDILYVLSDSNYCEVHTRTAQKKVRISFTELSRILAAYPPFAVIGRGVVVNFDYTSHISGCDCVMSNGDKVPVSRRKIKETEQAFLDRQFSRMLAEGN